MDDVYLDLARHPLLSESPQEMKKTVFGLFQEMGVGRQDKNGAYILKTSELQSGIKDIFSDPQKFDKIANVNLDMARRDLEDKEAEWAGVDKKIKENPDDKVLSVKFRDLTEAKDSALNTYNQVIAAVGAGKDRVGVLAEVRKMQENGVWEKLPDQLRYGIVSAQNPQQLDAMVQSYIKSVKGK